MATISTVCDNLFSQTNLAQLPRKPVRASRRNLARILYRQTRRPGLVNPSEPGPAPERAKAAKVEQTMRRPMRHVYRFHEPPRPKAGTLRARLRASMVPKFVRKAQRVSIQSVARDEQRFKDAMHDSYGIEFADSEKAAR